VGIKDIRKILAEKLRSFRERSGLTAKEVGEKVGKSEKTISAWEHGRGQPDADMLIELCSLYNVTIGDFFDQPQPQIEDLNSGETELVSIFRSLNKSGQELLLANARAFASNVDMQKEADGRQAI